MVTVHVHGVAWRREEKIPMDHLSHVALRQYIRGKGVPVRVRKTFFFFKFFKNSFIYLFILAAPGLSCSMRDLSGHGRRTP